MNNDECGKGATWIVLTNANIPKPKLYCLQLNAFRLSQDVIAGGKITTKLLRLTLIP
jgi:hypothetical protein